MPCPTLHLACLIGGLTHKPSWFKQIKIFCTEIHFTGVVLKKFVLLEDDLKTQVSFGGCALCKECSDMIQSQAETN